jgi:hypothetical protein
LGIFVQINAFGSARRETCFAGENAFAFGADFLIAAFGVAVSAVFAITVCVSTGSAAFRFSLIGTGFRLIAALFFINALIGFALLVVVLAVGIRFAFFFFSICIVYFFTGTSGSLAFISIFDGFAIGRAAIPGIGVPVIASLAFIDSSISAFDGIFIVATAATSAVISACCH